ncbi:hypothetical protein [Flavobacterium sp.]|uniref:hypothetical protein n=1 Tax=Flavobacterium sp. TaxID=239 RepID=UPI00286EA9A0|nr:hypothetical protein [Flavobacterium sp.]
MIKTLIFQTIILLFSLNTISQVKEKEKYSKAELKTFIKIYKHTLDFPFNTIVSMQQNALKIKISEQRLTEILQSQFAGNTIKLTDDESKEMGKLQKLMETDKEVYDKELEKYIISQKILPSKYKEIEKVYHKNNKFQKKVNKLYTK